MADETNDPFYGKITGITDEPLYCCHKCGAVVPHSMTPEHTAWHADIEARIAANRPDPRSAFIGG